jgi:hypothetical protein
LRLYKHFLEGFLRETADPFTAKKPTWTWRQARAELNGHIKTIFEGTTGFINEIVPFPAAPGEVNIDLGKGRPRFAFTANAGVAVDATVDSMLEIIAHILQDEFDCHSATQICKGF